MGFFDWIRGLLGGGSPAGAGGVPARAPGPPGTSRSAAGSAGSPASASGAAGGPARAPSPPQRRTVTLDLDLARFAPLSSADMHRAADALQNRFGAAWFGRRDIIPPAEDPRTNLIDRGMVGEGLVLPAELARIHDIGRRMDEVRPLAGAAAARAKADAVADRAALKARKQAEAAERRRRHSEEVAQRRATDIVFLGRGVSSGLADRTADAARLAAARLPLLATPGDVAAALGVTVPRLRWLAFHSDVVKTGHYVRFEVPKKSGGVRRLAAPRPHLAAAQRWILRNVLDLVPKHAAAHGFVAGRSTLTNAAPHVGRAVVVNADLKDFFPTITFPRVRGTFRELGYSPAAATVLALLATEAPRRTITVDGAEFLAATGPRALPQGACTSPAISNLVVRRMDSRLTAISAKLGFVYTRYADDLTFSGGPGTESKIGYLLARLRHIAQDEGFAVNEAKTRVQRRNAAQSVTGLVVNDRPGVPRKTVRRIRAILHRARHEGLAAQNRERRPNFEAWLRGMIAYVAMARPEQGAELRQELDALSG